MNRIPVNRELLTWARERAGMNTLELGGQDVVGRLWQEEQDIDVGSRIEFAAPVTSDGDQ